MNLRTSLSPLLAVAALGGAALAQPSAPSWRYYRPGNTGIQGDSCEAVWVAPDGNPWIAGYDPIFEEGGFARFVQAEQRWENWSNIDHPVIGHPNDQGKIRISDIVPDANGVLWMATWRGALRFDPAVGAASLTRIGPDNSLLADDTVWDIDRAPDGTLWFVNDGITRHDPATGAWTHWPTGLPYLAAQPKAGGGYLVWSSERPPYQSFTLLFDSATQAWTTLQPSGAPGEVVGMPGKDCVDEAGNFWALRSTQPGNWVSLDYRRPSGAWVAPPEPYASVTFDIWAFKAYGDRRALLVDGNSVVWQFDGAAWSSLGAWKSGAYTDSADIDAAGNVWVSGVGGAARRDAASGAWQRYRITNTGNFDSFNADLALDTQQGHVYVGANAGPGVGGMARFDGQRWTGWNNSTYGLGEAWPFLNDNCEALAYRSSSGRLAVSPLNWLYGIHEWTGTGFVPLLPGGGAERLCEDSLGRLWALGEYYSLQYLDGAGWHQVGLTAWGSRIRRDPERPGTVWAASGHEVKRTDGAYSFSRTIGDFPELTTQSDTFSGLAAAPGGVAWIGASLHLGTGGTGGALIRLDADTGSYEMLRHDQGWPLPGQYVQPLAVTPDGRVWMQYDSDYLTAKRGLCWWDGTAVGDFPAPPGGEPQWGGLPHAAIAALEVREIPGGYELWMSCLSRGIAVLTVPYEPAWSDLGQGLPGGGGTPALAGSGPLTPGSENGLDLSGAAPSAAATLVFGLTVLNAPFKGGLLVPAPLLLLPLGTDAAGVAALPFEWPVGVPAGTELYFQAWVPDAGAPFGLAASNGVRGVTP